jgi:hypothetical protein
MYIGLTLALITDLTPQHLATASVALYMFVITVMGAY